MSQKIGAQGQAINIYGTYVFYEITRKVKGMLRVVQPKPTYSLLLQDSKSEWASRINREEDRDKRHIVEKIREPEDCKHYPLCKHLQTRAGDMPTVLLLFAMQIEADSVCGECHDFEPDEVSKMT